MEWTVRLADALVSLGEGFLWLYVGPRLLGFRPGRRVYVLSALLVGILIILISEANRRVQLPLGVHNLLILVGVVCVTRWLLGLPWGAAAAGALATNVAGFAGALALIGLAVVLHLDTAHLLGAPVLYLVAAVLEHGFLILLAVAIWRRGIVLFDATTPSPGLRGTLALLTAFLAQSYVLVFMGVLSAANRTPLWKSLPWGVPAWAFWLLVTALPVVAIFLVRHLDRLHRSELRARENERMASLGRMAAMLAHEVRNPVTVIKGYLQMGERFVRAGLELPPPLQEAFLLGTQQVVQLERLLTDFLILGRMGGRREAPEPVDLARVVREVVEGARQVAAGRPVEVLAEVPESAPPIEAVPQRLQQMLDNLVRNGLESIEDAGRVRVTLEVTEGGRLLVLRVADSGRGIPPEVQKQIFEPFFTTKPDGTGLGLVVVKRIVEDLGGDVAVRSHPGEGTEFTVRIPVGAGTPATPYP